MPKYSIPELLPIDSPRDAGLPCAPLMRPHFAIPGVMELQTPVSDAEATKICPMGLSLNGVILAHLDAATAEELILSHLS